MLCGEMIHELLPSSRHGSAIIKASGDVARRQMVCTRNVGRRSEP
jgi:hypothetical protein